LDDTCCLSPAVEFVLVDSYSKIKPNDLVLLDFYGTNTCRRYYDTGKYLLLKSTDSRDTIVSQREQHIIIGIVTEVCKKALIFGKSVGIYGDNVLYYESRCSNSV
jgi:hypothetical protein